MSSVIAGKWTDLRNNWDRGGRAAWEAESIERWLGRTPTRNPMRGQVFGGFKKKTWGGRDNARHQSA